MNPSELIKKKRNNLSLTKEELKFIIEGYVSGDVAEYQMSAFLMAVYFRGMSDEETFHLTDIMLNSGVVLDFSHIKKAKIDKHSTGGVGDKTSLILAPLVACEGIAVPMISGRGLGHTGGTLDKLESIPGFNVSVSIAEFKRLLEINGVVLAGQTKDFAPADKRIYSLRDVTATVECIPLITSSIMSKKLAEGADGFVFDVKIGCGANLPGTELPIELAKKLIYTSRKSGKKAIAVLSDMEQPLGRKIGNWLEVEESIELMSGSMIPDLFKLTTVLAGAMIFLGGRSGNIEEGEKIAVSRLMDKSAYKKFLEIVESQNGDVNYVKDWTKMRRSRIGRSINAKSNGFISEMKADEIGFAAIELGCGRKKIEDKIDPLAGIILRTKIGDEIKSGEPILDMFADSEERLDRAEERLNKAIKVSREKPAERKLIIDILD
jgi:pyrimidine-nucleoside phosphorylase